MRGGEPSMAGDATGATPGDRESPRGVPPTARGLAPTASGPATGAGGPVSAGVEDDDLEPDDEDDGAQVHGRAAPGADGRQQAPEGRQHRVDQQAQRAAELVGQATLLHGDPGDEDPHEDDDRVDVEERAD